MLGEPTDTSIRKNCIKSSIALQVNFMGRADVQVRMTHLERDRQSVVLELRYGRHEVDLNRATSWYRALWLDPTPQ